MVEHFLYGEGVVSHRWQQEEKSVKRERSKSLKIGQENSRCVKNMENHTRRRNGGKKKKKGREKGVHSSFEGRNLFFKHIKAYTIVRVRVCVCRKYGSR